VPKREDINTILIIGSGPIVIGQACEFDYSGTQACKVLREEGYRVILVNSNPATIMTDPEMADRTYIEPMTVASVEQIIEREKPDALLPTVGGQTALNLAIELSEQGVLEKHGVEMIGANLEAILKAEDREQFRTAMEKIGLSIPLSGYVRSVREARELLEKIGLPAIIRPSFTLGGAGAGIANTDAEFDRVVEWGLLQSPRHEVLLEQSVLGWKEFELEVMRDTADNVVIICSIENLDPMGVHTGDSITVAPAQTLTDKEYQVMRDASLAIIREIGVDTGGSNVQFAVNPDDGRLVVVEMNPRVSRSSALASKATGFPIAKIAAKLAVGYTLDEISNDITRETPASFEPSIDYVVTKIPRFAFEKFPTSDQSLSTQMKSVGEVMGIGRTFKESLHKAIRSLEIDHYGFEPTIEGDDEEAIAEIWSRISIPCPGRLWAIADGFRRGFDLEEIYARSMIDRWFLRNIEEIVLAEEELAAAPEAERVELLRPAKRLGFSDRRLADLWNLSEAAVRELRIEHGITPVFKRVDTCGAEFAAHTPYLYSTYEQECEAEPSDRQKVMILGSGPNRIGQGIEFDYCCVHAAFALHDAGYETIMVNCNPETVSTDYDTSDRLYFEPLTLEDVLAIYEREKPMGVIVTFGGQTPLKLAIALEQAGVPILGTSPEAIDRAEDRERFDEVLEKLQLKRPPSGISRSPEEAVAVAEKIGYPVLVRPSYVLGGRAMQIVHNEAALNRYMHEAVMASPDHPVLIDHFLADCVEVDVDAVCDGERVIIAGVMEHIEEAGVHSGDSACSIPPFSLEPETIKEIKQATERLALELEVRGLMNVQYGIQQGEVYVLEVNPRASRTVPYVAKAVGVQLAKIGALVMIGQTLDELGLTRDPEPHRVAVKQPVFPFLKFPGVDVLLGPEMKSTGEVMGIDSDFGRAYAKAQIQAGAALPLSGRVLVTVRPEHRPHLADVVRELAENGFEILGTEGTAADFNSYGIPTKVVPKPGQGSPNTFDVIENGEVNLVINTVEDDPEIVRDSVIIRRAALTRGIPYFTTAAGARAGVGAIRALQLESIGVRSLQETHARARVPGVRVR
jgi:carbamoyl-phosphate synthase large subunit